MLFLSDNRASASHSGLYVGLTGGAVQGRSTTASLNHFYSHPGSLSLITSRHISMETESSAISPQSLWSPWHLHLLF